MALTAVAIAWIVGLLAGGRWLLPDATLALWGLAAAALAALGLTLRHRLSNAALRKLAWTCAALAAFLLGAWWGGLPRNEGASEGVADLVAQGSVVLRGQVTGDPERLGAAYRFRLSRLEVETSANWVPETSVTRREVAGTILVTVRPSADLASDRSPPHFRYGDLLELRGAVEEPPVFPGFDYRDYLARQGVHGVMAFPIPTLVEDGLGPWPLEQVFRLRHAMAGSLARVLPELQAATVQALLLGLRRDLPPEVRESFVETGTSHLLAISGLHVAVLLGFFLGLGRLLLGGGRASLAPALVGLWLFAALTGMAPPVTRAALMGTLYLGARATGRESAGLPALTLAAAVMAALNPRLLGDVSFQLSFTAVASLIIVAPPVQRVLDALTERYTATDGPAATAARAFNLALAAGIAATLGTLPLIAVVFGRVSPLGIPVTLLALPALPLALVGGLLTAALEWVWGPLGQAAAWATWAPVTYLLALVRGAAAIPGASFTVGDVAPIAVAAYYAAGLALALRLSRVKARPGVATARLRGGAVAAKLRFRWAAPALAVAAVALWGAALASPDGRLHVTFLDVGQGDAILIETPSGRQVLVDGGPDPRLVLRALGDRMPFWDRSIDLVVLTHPQEDHLAGLVRVLRRYRVGRIITPGVEATSGTYAEWRRALAERSDETRVLVASVGQEVVMGDGVSLTVLHPPGTLPPWTPNLLNNSSVVLRVTYVEVSFLLTGDIEAAGEQDLIESDAPLRATVLKVAHHGSDSSSTKEFLDAVTPAMAVISVGADNRFGHPRASVVERLRAATGDRVLLSSERGAIEMTTDGRRLWVKTER